MKEQRQIIQTITIDMFFFANVLKKQKKLMLNR